MHAEGALRNGKELREDAILISLSDLREIQKCRLWSGIVKPLEGISLEHVRYISPEMEKELGYREEFVKKSWNQLQDELKTAGVLENKVLEWAAEIEKISANEHYFADGNNVRVKKKKPCFNIYRTGDSYCFTSPLLARDAYNEVSKFTPISELSKDAEFLANLDLLEKEYKPEYSKGSREDSPVGPVFDRKSIDKMLSEEWLVQAEELKKNAAAAVKDLHYYKASYERRKAFEAEVMKRTKAKHFEYAIHEKHDVADEWYKAFVQSVYENVNGDETVCRLVNGQSECTARVSWTKNVHYTPKVNEAFQNKDLTLERFSKWIQTLYADSPVRFALQGLDPKILILYKAGDRLQEQYNHADNAGDRFITEQEFFGVYPDAVRKLAGAFDQELLKFSPKTLS